MAAAHDTERGEALSQVIEAQSRAQVRKETTRARRQAVSWARQVSGRRLAAGSAVRPTQTWHGHGPGPWRAEFESGYKGGGCKAWTYGFGCKAGAGAVTHKLDELTDSTTTLCALVLFCLLCVLPRRQVCCVSGLVSCRIQPVRKGRARGTAAWLCGDAGGSHLSAPTRGEVASKSKPSPSPKMSSRTLTAPGAMGTSKSSCQGGARGRSQPQLASQENRGQADPRHFF